MNEWVSLGVGVGIWLISVCFQQVKALKKVSMPISFYDQPEGVLAGLLTAFCRPQRRPVWTGHEGSFCCCGYLDYVTAGLMLSRAKGTQLQKPDGCFWIQFPPAANLLLKYNPSLTMIDVFWTWELGSWEVQEGNWIPNHPSSPREVPLWLRWQ